MGAGPPAAADSRWWRAAEEDEDEEGGLSLSEPTVCECTSDEALGVALALASRMEGGGTIHVERRVWEAAAQQAELERLERESRSVEAQLRRARFENGQLELLKVSQDEEVRSLKEKLLMYTGDKGEAEASFLLVPKLQEDVEELRRSNEQSREMAETAARLRTEAEEDMSKERLANKRLLERLLL